MVRAATTAARSEPGGARTEVIATGLDRLLEDPSVLAGRRYGLLTHLPAVSADLVPSHLALGRSETPPVRLFAPEHGLAALAQDMEPTAAGTDPWTDLPVVSLYGHESASLRPDREAFDDLDLLVIDLQDVGARYYTYVTTAIWAAEVGAASDCEIWVLDRPNPLGGECVEGNLRRPGFDSFVGAFDHPVVHGLTLGELASMELERAGCGDRLRVWHMAGWQRRMLWAQTGRPWIAPSPNMPGFETAAIYPGLCLVEATTLSEGRGTTRPFQLVGSPEIDPVALAGSLGGLDLPGVAFAPTLFRPEFQKHAGAVCGGVEVVVRDAARLAPYRLGVELLCVLAEQPGFAWRGDAYEFVTDRPAIDLLTGDDALRRAVGAGGRPDDWIDSWAADEAEFRRRREPHLLYG